MQAANRSVGAEESANEMIANDTYIRDADLVNSLPPGLGEIGERQTLFVGS